MKKSASSNRPAIIDEITERFHVPAGAILGTTRNRGIYDCLAIITDDDVKTIVKKMHGIRKLLARDGITTVQSVSARGCYQAFRWKMAAMFKRLRHKRKIKLENAYENQIQYRQSRQSG